MWALASAEGLKRGLAFRLKELTATRDAAESRFAEAARRRGEFRASALGQLSGCPEFCFTCFVPGHQTVCLGACEEEYYERDRTVRSMRCVADRYARAEGAMQCLRRFYRQRGALSPVETISFTQALRWVTDEAQ